MVQQKLHFIWILRSNAKCRNLSSLSFEGKKISRRRSNWSINKMFSIQDEILKHQNKQKSCGKHRLFTKNVFRIQKITTNPAQLNYWQR